MKSFLFFFLILCESSWILHAEMPGDCKNSISDSAVYFEQDHKMEIPLVSVGDPGNQADPKTGIGNVAYIFQIGKFDIKATEYCAFLNAVATIDDPYHLYNSKMESDSRVSSIKRYWNSASQRYSYSIIPGREDFPIVYVTWFSAARFCNWLENNQPEGPEGPMTTERGSYTFNGSPDSFDAFEIFKSYAKQFVVNPEAHWRLPSADEWYKAAYYKGGGDHAGYWLYPTQSDEAPSNIIGNQSNQANYYASRHYATNHDWINNCSYYFSDRKPYLTAGGAFSGSPGPYGTYDMGGNVWQWNDFFTVKNINTDQGVTCQGARGIGGGAWASVSGEYLSRGSFEQLQLESDGLNATKFSSFSFYQTCSDACIGFRVVRRACSKSDL